MISIYHINAFSTGLSSGNPAAVCMLEEWLEDDVLQSIAIENNLPITTFLKEEDGEFFLRWFTVNGESALCGHGTLATAWLLFQKQKSNSQVVFSTNAGLIRASYDGEWVTINLEIKKPQPIDIPNILTQGLGQKPQALYEAGDRVVAILPNEKDVLDLDPDMGMLKQLPFWGVVVTASGNDVDFVSRTLYPKKTMTEDPVAGSSHCLLVPYWAEKLEKKKLTARQLSQRGGYLKCGFREGGVSLSGQAFLYMEGSVHL